MSSLETADARRAERRWLIVGILLVVAVMLVQLAGGLVRRALTDEPSYRELVETCLTERDVPFGPVTGDLIALSASRGALRTSVLGNPVTVALGGSEREAQRILDAYSTVGTADVGARLELRRKVVFLWDAPSSAAQREFAHLCTRDAQE